MRTSVRLALGAVLLAGISTCGGKSSPAAPTPSPCVYSLSPASLTFEPQGGSASVGVATASHCAWTAVSDRAWMTIDAGASGTGAGVVIVTAAANGSSADRGGALTIAGQAVPVTVRGSACTIDLTPASAAYGKDDAAGRITVAAAADCPWTAVSRAAWIAVTEGAAGRGNGTVAYTVERNRELTDRTGTIAVADRLFPISQQADTPAPPVCEYSVAPVAFAPCMAAASLTAAIVTQPGCTWTVEPDAPWIALTTGGSGAGSAAIVVRVTDNYELPRQGVVRVRWPSVTAGQNLHVSQAGCRYAVSTSAIAMPADGGTGRFDVFQQSDPIACGGPLQDACTWTAQSDSTWIAIGTAMPQAGDNHVSFTVAPNGGALERSGSITVKGQLVRITQAGR